MENLDLGKIAMEACEKIEKDTGRVNVLIAGKTGVGKSTLINSIFHGNMAETGQGKPVTQTTKEITKEGIPLSIFDTRGLETKEYKETLKELKDFVSKRRNESDVNKQIHVAWICITEDSRRVEEAEIELVEMLAAQDIPVIGIITKARADNGFKSGVEKLLPKARNIIRVRAIAEILDEGMSLPPMGLENLVEVTQEVIPDGRRNAFSAAQKASLKEKVQRAQIVISSSAAAAAAAGASPIPFSDAALLIPIEVTMLAGISKVFGLNLTKGFLGTLVSAMLGSTGATIAGKAIVAALLKATGAGEPLGMAISGTTALTLTTALGELYTGTLTGLFSALKGATPTYDQIEVEFKKQLSQKKK